jgi:predicted nuclease with TOPRIM domain
MVVMTPRESWTDERLDDLAKGVGEVRVEVIEVRKEVAHVREELGELRAEIKGLKETTRAKFDAVDKRFDDLTRTIQIVFAVLGSVLAANTAMLVGLIGWIVTQQ